MAEIIRGFESQQAQRIEAPDTSEIKRALDKNIKGQPEAGEFWSGALHRVMSGTPKLRQGPLTVVTEIGPSGVGKTEIVRQAANYLAAGQHKKPRVLRIDCGEYQEEHEVAKVLGSPPGYKGHGETTPRLAQSEIDENSIDLGQDRSVTIVLFDEIEKAHPNLNNTLLGALDYGVITLGDNSKTNLENCIIVFTSNLGNQEIGLEEDAGKQLSAEDKRRIRLGGMKRYFTPEQLSRMGGETNTIIFNELSRETITEILVDKLNKFEQEFAKIDIQINFQLTEAGVDKLLELGYSNQEGVRKLEIVLEQQLASKLTTLKETESKIPVVIDAVNGQLELYVPKSLVFRSPERLNLPGSTKTEVGLPAKKDRGPHPDRLETSEKVSPEEIFSGYLSFTRELGQLVLDYMKNVEGLVEDGVPETGLGPSLAQHQAEIGYLHSYIMRVLKKADEHGKPLVDMTEFKRQLTFHLTRMAEIIIAQYRAKKYPGDDIKDIQSLLKKAIEKQDSTIDELVQRFENLFIKGYESSRSTDLLKRY